ncbi:MAG TPA: ATP-grasp domain-containing protein [Halanaerobiales bacterium]|nr:ATP-grasp domain-containing protein [Halanaerobiales bacterium]
MRLLILGGGNGQLSSIKKAKEMGHEVVVSDYYKNAPGKKFSDFSENISTFDIDGNIKVAKKYNIDGVMTVGTDQPVFTAMKVAKKLNLPRYLTEETARAVTNKREMKKTFSKYDIPTVNYKIINKNFSDKKLANINFPVVIKPLDSQGQRGVFKLNSIKEIRKHFSEVLNYSRENEILVEEYYKSDEITVSGWVNQGNLNLLTITDRVTHENNSHIGICSAHIFPSKHLKKYYNQIKAISEKIVDSFKIKNGPIYFQILVGENGLKVNEIACRIGGAYEGDFMPWLTGVDILEMMVNISLGENINGENLNNYNITNNSKWLSVQLFYAKPGKITEITSTAELVSLKGVVKAGFNFEIGDKIQEIENATERAGYFILRGKNKLDLKQKIKNAYDNLKIIDSKENNLVIREIGEVL